MFVVLDDYPLPCLLIVRKVLCSLTQMQSTFSCWRRKVAAKLISRRWYWNVVTVRLPIVLFCVNSKICRKTDFINLLTYVLYQWCSNFLARGPHFLSETLRVPQELIISIKTHLKDSSVKFSLQWKLLRRAMVWAPLYHTFQQGCLGQMHT